MGEVWLICDVDTEFDCFRPGYRGNIGKENPGLTLGVREYSEFFHNHDIKGTFHVQEQSDTNFSILTKYPEVYDIINEYEHEISLHVHVKEEDYNTRFKEIGTALNRLNKSGYKLSSFKAGWYFTNENTIRVLDKFGIQFDCSPLKNTAVGPMNWFNIPDSPYHPDFRDITKIGDAKILVMPITNSRLQISIRNNTNHEVRLMEKGTKAIFKISETIEQPVIIFLTTHSWKPINPKDSSFRKWEKKRRISFFKFLSKFEIRSLKVQEAGSIWKKRNYKSYWLDLPDLAKDITPFYRPSRYLCIARHLVPFLHRLRYYKSREL